MWDLRHDASRLAWRGGVSVAAALLLAACSATAASTSGSNANSTGNASTASRAARGGETTTIPRSSKLLIAPRDVTSIVASDTATNNRANALLSIALQDSHETCLQEVLDDATYRGDQAAGSNTLGGSFDQVPSRAFVPRENRYPAYFSVLVEDRSSSEPTTNNLLTYVKTSASTRWKLASSSEILGPTANGVPVPPAATETGGYVTGLDPAATDGLAVAPDQVAARVAAAFSSEAASGKLPTGITAQFGPQNEADPHSIASPFAGMGTVTTEFTTTAPAAARASEPSPDCPYPAFRLAGGGALVTFAVFVRTDVHFTSGSAVTQPSDRSAFGVLLPPGTYSSVTMVSGDMDVAIVPPLGSRSPIDVIGQAREGLSESGLPESGSSNAPGGPADASSIAKKVDPMLVDINTTLNYEDEEAAGTGMVLTPNGEVLTNNHVIEGATSITVTDVGNGRTYTAKVLGYDRTSDVAVLQLKGAANLPAISVGNSSLVHTGNAVVGIGNAAGRGGTPSYAGGFVVALHRSITASDSGDGTSEQLTGLIETNADIQPGDSGGPLVTSNGKVIGMDTAASAGFEFQSAASLANEGFAIPINNAIGIAGQIAAAKSSAAVHIGATAFLGVNVESPGAINFNWFGGLGATGQGSTTSGAEVVRVIDGSPAARAGLSDGDTITSLGGESVTSPNALTKIVLKEKPGTLTKLGYVDPNGKRHTVTMRLASGPPQ
jgi:S1-C subfamily serine protease